MKTSIDGAQFIACREALVSRAYVDGKHKDGRLKYSIGFGSQTNEPKEGDTITIEDAFARLKADIAERDITIRRIITAPIRQCEWDAVASLFYQSGTKALRTVGELFNAGEPIFAMAAFLQFNKDQGVPSKGLTKRRIREMIMGVDRYYGDLSQVAFFDGNPRTAARQYMPFPANI